MRSTAYAATTSPASRATSTRLQQSGLAADDIDAGVAAGALCAMVEGFGRHWYGRGEQDDAPYDDDTAVETLTRLWARGLGLRPQSEHQR